ncbi:MAG TPA: hypothetical protein VIL33_01465 [Rhodothermia bacterium]
MSKREQILDAVMAALTNVTGVDNANVYRSRSIALARDKHPALIVEPINDTPDNPNIHRLNWTLTFQVMVMYRTDSAPDEAADDTVASVHSKIMASSSLEALVSNLLPGPVDWEFTGADKPLGVVRMQFQASYITTLGTL